MQPGTTPSYTGNSQPFKHIDGSFWLARLSENKFRKDFISKVLVYTVGIGLKTGKVFHVKNWPTSLQVNWKPVPNLCFVFDGKDQIRCQRAFHNLTHFQFFTKYYEEIRNESPCMSIHKGQKREKKSQLAVHCSAEIRFHVGTEVWLHSVFLSYVGYMHEAWQTYSWYNQISFPAISGVILPWSLTTERNICRTPGKTSHKPHRVIGLNSLEANCLCFYFVLLSKAKGKNCLIIYNRLLLHRK